MIIRKEKPEDVNGIHSLNERAFGQPLEANIVDKLRTNYGDLLSLVAVENEKIIGMGLGPMAVLPERQRQGVGTRLVKAGLEELRLL